MPRGSAGPKLIGEQEATAMKKETRIRFPVKVSAPHNSEGEPSNDWSDEQIT